jgi:hypothetical protein
LGKYDMGAHALLIGVSRFDDPKLAKLNSPQSDVEAFASVLKDQSRGAFQSVTVSVDQDLLTIRDQLSALLDGRSADDMVLFYYSGHGIVAKGQRLYLATGQSSFDKPQSRSLATSEIRDMMEQSRAGRLVVILDCCHSGVFAEGAKGAAATVTDETFGSGDGAEGQYVLTASDALQYAYDGTGVLVEAKPGPVLSKFTSWLVDGLAKGDASPFDEQITLDSLYQYLCRRARADGHSMTPQRFVKRGSGELVIAKNPMAKTLAVPEPLMANLDSPDWKIRKAAIGELGNLAKQPRMGSLVKKVVLDRVSDERDVDVREAMVTLLQRLGAGPQPGPEPVSSDPPKQPEPQPVKPARPHRPEPVRPQVVPFVSTPAPLTPVDEWQTLVLVKSGVPTTAMTGPNGPYLLMELQRRANGLRIATYMCRLSIAAAIFLGLFAFGEISNAPGSDLPFLILFPMIGFGVAGLLNRKSSDSAQNLPNDVDLARLKQAIPLIQARWGWGFGWVKREYEATRYHQGCWWLVGVGLLSFLMVATQI